MIMLKFISARSSWRSPVVTIKQASTNLLQNLSFKSAFLLPTVSMQRRLYIQLVHSFVFHITSFPSTAWLHFSVFKSNTSQNSSPRSDEGLILKTSALETF